LAHAPVPKTGSDVLLIVLVVVFTMAMFLWLLALLGAAPGLTSREGLCAWFAVLVLGIVVFLLGSGAVAWRGP